VAKNAPLKKSAITTARILFYYLSHLVADIGEREENIPKMRTKRGAGKHIGRPD
jgi:hypothetical protein